MGYPVFDTINAFVTQETIERGEEIKAKYGKASLDEFDELENGGDKGGAVLWLCEILAGRLLWGAKRKMLERGWKRNSGIGKTVGGNEAILGRVAWVLEGEGTAATATHAEEVYVGIEVVANLGKVAGGDVDDGVV